MRYDEKDLSKVGKHDFVKIDDTNYFLNCETISVNIFPIGLYTNGKKLKQLKGVVRVHGHPSKIEKINETAEEIVKLLDAGEWDGRKNVSVK